jgi:hypothetical protein
MSSLKFVSFLPVLRDEDGGGDWGASTTGHSRIRGLLEIEQSQHDRRSVGRERSLSSRVRRRGPLSQE